MRLAFVVPILVFSTWGASLPVAAQDALTEEDVRGIVRSVLDEHAEGGGSADDGEWIIGKKNRLSLTSPDGRFEYRIGGRVHQHWTAWSADDEFAAAGAPLEDSAYLRRARFYLTALLYENLFCKIEYDFAGGSAQPADVYLEFRDLPFATFRVGHFYEPFGLDVLTSDNDSTFVERASAESGESPNRNMGVMLFDGWNEERGTWAVGAFRPTDSSGSVESEGQFSYTGRVTYLPVDEDEGRRLLHVGAAASHRNFDDDTVDYTVEPEARKASDLLDSGVLMAETALLWSGELGAVFGPLSCQAEYIAALNDIENGSDADFSSWYAQLSWILTGEHREYRRAEGAFGGVKPTRNFREDGGWGAFETAIRWSSTDLEDGGIDGGTMDQLTLGANWYLNPNVRIMANVLLIDVESIAGNSGVDGRAQAFTMRFQVAF